MSTRRFANTYQTVNLFKNGGFDLVSVDQKIPEVWDLYNAQELSSDGAENSNTYELVLGEDVTQAEGLRDYLRVNLIKAESVGLAQEFVSNTSVNKLDFQVPQAAGVRASIASGYASTENQLLPARTPYTLALTARVIRGAARISIKLFDLNLNEIESGSNLLLFPNDFSQWTGSASVFTDTDSGPFFDNKADVIEDASTTALQFRYLDVDSTDLIPGTYAFGAYLKEGADPVNGGRAKQARLIINELSDPTRSAFGTVTWASNNLVLSTVDPSDSFVEGSITSAPNGYFLTEVRKKILGTSSVRCEIQPGFGLADRTGNLGAYGAYLRNVSDDIDPFDPISINRVGSWRRYTESFGAAFGIGKIEIVISKESGDDLTEVHLGNLSLTQGNYSKLPYTGDPSLRAFPKGAIILTMGDQCPAGFVELGEGGLTPPDSWVDEEPNIQARKGNYPRNSISLDLEGTVTHNVDALDLTPGATDVSEFEGPSSKVVLTRDGQGTSDLIDTSISNPAADLPGSDTGEPLHEHSLNFAKHRPVSRSFRFCKRL